MVYRHNLQRFQEGEQFVGCMEPTTVVRHWTGSRQGPLLQRDVGMDVHLGGFHTLVSQPEGDDGAATPLCRSSMAAVCLRTCGVTRLFANVGHLCATAVYLRTMRSTASRLNGVLRAVVNSGSSGPPPCSSIQAVAKALAALSERSGPWRRFPCGPLPCI